MNYDLRCHTVLLGNMLYSHRAALLLNHNLLLLWLLKCDAKLFLWTDRSIFICLVNEK